MSLEEHQLNSGSLAAVVVVHGIQVDRLSLVVKVVNNLALVVAVVLVLMQVLVMVAITDQQITQQLLGVQLDKTLDQVAVEVERIQIHSPMVVLVDLVSFSSHTQPDKYLKT
jgi:hypothetical protein